MGFFHRLSALYLGGAALFEYETDPVGWAIACAASLLLPDADLPTSKLGRALFWLSTRLEKRFGHRTITHSVIAIAALALLSSPAAVLQDLGVLRRHEADHQATQQQIALYQDKSGKSGSARATTTSLAYGTSPNGSTRKRPS